MKQTDLPKTGLAGLKTHFKDDLLAGFGVSLIALPLSLGVSLASGVPPLAGLITAIIGGLIASRVAGTFVTISGPAAGLIVVTSGAVNALGYADTLAAILFGSLIMLLLGFLKVGKLGDFFPSAAVRGMLAAIGIIIIIKQFFPALGLPTPKEKLLVTAAKIPQSFLELNVYAVTITILTLAVLILHPFLKLKFLKMIPAPMWVLILTIPMAIYIGPERIELIELPHKLFGKDGITYPTFNKLGTSVFWTSVMAFALVSSLETMLSAKAIDKLDPYKRTSDLNQDLVSMGIGSSIASTIGGLPMISAIVRSSANVNNGAKTQWSNFFHGLFLLFYLLVGAAVIEMIPIAALAAMLVFTGFKLASPKIFKMIYRIGKLEFIVYLVTIISVLATDLLVGIAIGILLNYLLILIKGVSVKTIFTSILQTDNFNNDKRIHLKGVHFFSNYLSLKSRLDKLFKLENEITLDFAEVKYVDHTVIEHLYEYKRRAKLKDKELTFLNLYSLTPLSAHPMASRKKSE